MKFQAPFCDDVKTSKFQLFFPRADSREELYEEALMDIRELFNIKMLMRVTNFIEILIISLLMQ